MVTVGKVLESSQRAIPMHHLEYQFDFLPGIEPRTVEFLLI